MGHLQFAWDSLRPKNRLRRAWVTSRDKAPAARDVDTRTSPATVDLEEGSYDVRWIVEDLGQAAVTVSIARDQTTRVDVVAHDPASYSLPEGEARVRVAVHDVLGASAPGVTVSLLDAWGNRRDRSTGDDGIATFVVPEGKLQVRVGLCQAERSVTQGAEAQIELPGESGRSFGELDARPVEWEARIRLRETETWRPSEAADSRLGRRFLFLPEGTYEIGYPDGRVAGTVEVRAGLRSEFVFTKGVGILLAPKIDPTVTPVPDTMMLVVRRTDGAFVERRIQWVPRADADIALYDLEPGVYEVVPADLRFAGEWRRALDAGQLVRAEFVVRRK